MHILVLNPGSSSIKFAMYADGGLSCASLYSGELNDIGEAIGGAEVEEQRWKGPDRLGGRGQGRARWMRRSAWFSA